MTLQEAATRFQVDIEKLEFYEKSGLLECRHFINGVPDYTVIVNKKVPLLSEEIPHLFLNLYRWGSPPIKNPIILNLCKPVFLYVYFQH